ncbi:hypothetical protein BGX34_003644 [Mortierella sp. NVP85]|nr:hypothetical protein BGX34_003644 [Mortierella sp. NVP85]
MAADLPELRQHIVQYLDFDTLKTFSLVCKAWYLDAYAILWKHFSCKAPWENPASSEGYPFWLDTVRQNAHSFKHIYNMEYNERTPEIGNLLLDRCHGLVSIDGAVTMIDIQDPGRYWEETLRPLVEQNKASMRRLQLRTMKGSLMASLQLPSLLASLSHLRSLELYVMRMDVEDLLPVLDACSSSLERLDLRPHICREDRTQGNSVTCHPPTTTATSLRLKRLYMASCNAKIVDDVLSRLAAHSLEKLHLETLFRLPSSSKPRDALWRLTHLCLENIRPISALPQILDAIQPHQLRYVRLGSIDTECSTKLIEQQHRSLEFLNVQLIYRHTEALADILATCRKLKVLVFTAPPIVDIQTLIDPQRPWLCTELEVFGGCFLLPSRPSLPSNSNEVDDTESSRQIGKAFMQRLGQLTKLRSLAQDVNRRGFTHRDVKLELEIMTWSLSSGLMYMTGLVNLQSLRFLDRDLPKGVGIPEMEFIKRHWRNLQELECYEIKDAEVQHWLEVEWPELKVKTKQLASGRLTQVLWPPLE